MNNKFFVIFLLLIANQSIRAQYPNIQLNHPSSTTPEEVTIAINPTNPLNLCAGANIDYSYYSTDGGYHWIEQHVTSPDFGVWGDPCIVYDGNGNVYFAHLSNPPSSGYWIDRIVVQKSTDGGAVWNPGVGIGYNPPVKVQDKEWLVADMTSSAYRNNLYVAWTEFDRYGSYDRNDSTRILFARSTDAGLSWSAPVRVSDRGGNCVDSDSTVEGAVPAIGPDGEVYLSWAGPHGILFDKSVDGGVTFGEDIYVTDQPGGWDFNIPGIYRCNGMPVTACDLSNSIHRGNIYVQWSDQRYGVENTDVFIIRSTDQGTTWGSVVRVNDDATTRQQFFSWMAVDQSTGNVYVVFYDRRDTELDSTNVYIARSTDGGETFQNIKVNNSPFFPLSSVFFGDYTNIAARDGMIYPIWMRLDRTILSVWTALVDERQWASYSVDEGWNMICVSHAVHDMRKNSLFNTAVSSAFTYTDGYVVDDTLEVGKGYWLKYNHAEELDLNGAILPSAAITVKSGWNMIGSISTPVSVIHIGSEPPGIIVSGFYEYKNSQYTLADTLYPGKGYWVKANHSGTLLISSDSSQMQGKRIAFLKDSDMPPSPPISVSNTIPAQFVLEQNYPNPFNPSTQIRYELPARSWVSLKVFNVAGQEVAQLVNGYRDAGQNVSTFDAGNLQSGVYYCRIVAGSMGQAIKMILIK